MTAIASLPPRFVGVHIFLPANPFRTPAADPLPNDRKPRESAARRSQCAEPANRRERRLPNNQHECPQCGLKFVEFRNTGRLGCAYDYQEFREELLPLLENIHGETKHCGKTPRRLPQSKQAQNELVQLRNRLKQAISKEDYEEAARLRDHIRQLEES